MLQQHLTVGWFLLSVLFLKGFMSSITGPSMLEAFLGKSLPVKCEYNRVYYNYNKYWCRGSHWESCMTVVKTDGTEEEKRFDRTVIRDNHSQFEITVTVENFTLQDAGIYWCAIDRIGNDPNSRVNITVIAELPSTTIAVNTEYSSTISTAFPTENTRTGSGRLLYPITVLPVVFVVLVLILGGASFSMWTLKKKKATKSCGDVLPSKTPPLSDQATECTEVAYTSVMPTPAFASKSQIPANAEMVDYSSLRFSALNDQAIYANV